MKHYGETPPWEGRSSRYGWWKRGPEMWDGSGFLWELQTPLMPLEKINYALRNYRYTIQQALDDEVLFTYLCR